MSVQFNNYNPLQYNQQAGPDLTQGCRALDPKQIEQSLKFIPPGELLPLLLAQSNQRGKTLLDYIVEKVISPQSLYERKRGLECLHVLLQHFTPLEKRDIFTTCYDQADSLQYLIGCGILTPEEVDQLVALLLENLDVDFRKQIASYPIVQGKTTIHAAASEGNYNPSLIRALLKGFTEVERISILIIQDSKRRTPLHMAIDAKPELWSALLDGLTAENKVELAQRRDFRGIDCLQGVLNHLSPLEKIDLLSSPDSPMWELFFERCEDLSSEEIEKFVTLLLENLDTGDRKQIASSKNYNGATIIHLAAGSSNCSPLIRGLLEGIIGDERMSILTIQDYRGRTPLHMAPSFDSTSSDSIPLALLDGLIGEQKKQLCEIQAKKGEPALRFSELERCEKIRDNWGQFTITHVSGEIEAIHSTQWDNSKKLALLLFPRHDHNNAFSISKFLQMRENLVLLQDKYNVKLLRVSSVEEADRVLDSINDGEIDALFITGHGPGESERNVDGSVTFGERQRGLTHALLATHTLFMDTIVRKMNKGASTVTFISCALGREEEEITIPQQLALRFDGTVIASTKDITLTETYFHPDSPLIVTFGADGRDSTVVFTRDSVQAKLAQATPSP